MTEITHQPGSSSVPGNVSAAGFAPFQTLKLEQEGSLVRLTLARPDLLNRIDEPAHLELIRVFRELSQNQSARAILWNAEGRAFSAGGDLGEIARQQSDPNQRANMFRQALDIIHALLDVPVPIVVALHGDVFGLGTSLIFACDAVVAVRTARMADPHVKIGLVAGDGGCVVWPAAIGMMRAKRYLLTGDAITGEAAHQMGLVTDLVDTVEQCHEKAEMLATRIAGLPPIAVRGTKIALNAVLRARAAEVLALSLALEQQSIVSEDILEAVAAFREKRAGEYSGR
jgi:enoyl-CoA hydratase